MLSLRARIFIIISLVVLLILGISIFLSIRAKKAATTPTPTTTTGNVIDSTNFNYNTTIQTPVPGGVVPAGVPVKPVTTLEAEQNAVRQFAKIFVERYNSYSTDSNFQNIVDVKELVTPELWQTLSAKIGKPTTASSFVGVTTKVITNELKNWDGKAATVLLNTSINEEKNGVMSNRQQAITVVLAKSGSSWLVASFQWAK